jgi:hypothetical protein
MNVIAYAIAVVIILSGALFALQGLSLLPSRVMYGQPEWVVIGGLMVILGAALAVWANVRALRAKSAKS